MWLFNGAGYQDARVRNSDIEDSGKRHSLGIVSRHLFSFVSFFSLLSFLSFFHLFLSHFQLFPYLYFSKQGSFIVCLCGSLVMCGAGMDVKERIPALTGGTKRTSPADTPVI